MGSTCPVSNTFTDTRFAVPRGCHAVTTNVVKNDVRGQIEVQEPSANNGYRGELHLSDPYNGAGVFDFTITVTCQNTQASVGNAPQQNVRLSCVHNAGGQHTQPCNMGRMEVYNPHVTRPGAPGAGGSPGGGGEKPSAGAGGSGTGGAAGEGGGDGGGYSQHASAFSRPPMP